MEKNGFKVEKDVLDKMKSEIEGKIDVVARDIYNLTGCVFNIGSPKQLGEVLFDKLELAKGVKKGVGLTDNLITNKNPRKYKKENSTRINYRLKQINDMGTTIIMATHDLEIVRKMNERVIVIEEGRLVKDYEKGKYHNEGF